MKTSDSQPVQREIPILHRSEPARWVPGEIVKSWATYREAVIWCWQNRPCHGITEAQDQALFASYAGLHAPHMSRCVKPESKAPMDLKVGVIPEFEAWTGWHGVSQWVAMNSKFTIMEEVISERAA